MTNYSMTTSLSQLRETIPLTMLSCKIQPVVQHALDDQRTVVAVAPLTHSGKSMYRQSSSRADRQRRCTIVDALPHSTFVTTSRSAASNALEARQ
ncbi:hypothetical protein [Xanthomonas hortorum]|uniref:hypothetical protein n=1 Tax=Xanthomonas hortorum TaxID=56454 RepID=UPI001F32C37E|nr:hypothetical protein [Xanthomonas hortorum]MCE4364794.1 hypothetical protein [Xanthomonas hortorum]